MMPAQHPDHEHGYHHDRNDHYETSGGIGPGLVQQDDLLQRSETENERHQKKTQQNMGQGPGLSTKRAPSPGPSSPELARKEREAPPTGGSSSQQPIDNAYFRDDVNRPELHHHPEHREKEELEKIPETPAEMARVPTVPDLGHNHGKHHKLLSPKHRLSGSTNVTPELLQEHLHTLELVREALGLPGHAPLVEGHEQQGFLTWPTIRIVLREPFAEFWGTFIMILFGCGSVAQVLLSNAASGAIDPTTAPGGNGWGAYQSISWGWGLGVMLGIYVAGDSGGFLNPAITLCFCIFRKLPWRRLPIYLAAQLLGAFCASAVVYAVYIPAIDQVEGGKTRTVPPASTATAGVFSTYPQPFLSQGSMFVSELVASAILMFVIFAMKDDSNPGAMGKSGAGQLFPLVLFFLIFGLGACFGWETGYAINPARDLGPRLMSYCLGYGRGVWSAAGYYFWVPMVAPFVGTVMGGLAYDVFIYTGPESPVNWPWFGVGSIYQATTKWRRRSHEKAMKDEEMLVESRTNDTVSTHHTSGTAHTAGTHATSGTAATGATNGTTAKATRMQRAAAKKVQQGIAEDAAKKQQKEQRPPAGGKAPKSYRASFGGPSVGTSYRGSYRG